MSQVALVQPATCQRPAPDGFNVEASAVVGECQHQTLARDLGPQRDPPCGCFSTSYSNVGRLDAMVHRVANQVHNRLTQALQHRPVGHRAAVVDIKEHLLLGSAGHLADLQADLAEDRRQRQHPRPADLCVYPLDDCLQPSAGFSGLVPILVQLLVEAGD